MKKILIILVSVLALGVMLYFGWFRYGTLEISSLTSPLNVKINKKEFWAAKMPKKVRLTPGTYTVQVGIKNFSDFESTVKVEARKKTTLVVEIEGKEDVEASELFYQKNPLTKFLPISEENFKIDFYQKGSADITYIITLYPVSVPDQAENYRVELIQYKKEALDWIKNKGVDPNTIKLEWLPLESKDL